MDSTRLPWRRTTGHRGFNAFPEGDAHPERNAVIKFYQPNNSWTWRLTYDGASSSGVAGTIQAASDAANAAWPAVIEEARKAAGRSEWERDQLELVAKIERGELPPDHFANAAADHENLMWVMDRIKPRPGLGPVTGGIQRLVDAISRELYRRRTGK